MRRLNKGLPFILVFKTALKDKLDELKHNLIDKQPAAITKKYIQYIAVAENH